MIIDTSALIAILFAELDAEIYARALATADRCRISAANYVETAIVVEAQTRNSGSRDFDTFFRRAAIAIEPVTEEHAHLARDAYVRFGKGRHRAGLNFGDAFAYALAKASGEPLLYKGKDFGKTDIRSAL
ncbi:MAG TPA: type II toxin-antitoxin system VapC family toxin [Casimicrobiaceae bacterium]|nr:type II toxin-antitoxin system VapC family toxin [Casimicrobiaceae bacterium]